MSPEEHAQEEDEGGESDPEVARWRAAGSKEGHLCASTWQRSVISTVRRRAVARVGARACERMRVGACVGARACERMLVGACV